MAVGRTETTSAAGKQWTLGQKIGVGIGAAALVGLSAYGAYSHYQNQHPNGNPFVDAQQERARTRGYDLQMEPVNNKRSAGGAAPQSSKEFFSNPANEWEIHAGPATIKRR